MHLGRFWFFFEDLFYGLKELEHRVGLGGGTNISFKFNTILIIYDGFGSLAYATDLLKNGCFACISPSYDKNTKMRTFIALLEGCSRFWLYCYIHYHNLLFHSIERLWKFNLPDSYVPVLIEFSDITYYLAGLRGFESLTYLIYMYQC